MTFNEILKELSKKYTLAPKANNVVEIVINKGFTALNYYFLAIKQEDQNIFITDYANTLECLNISKDDIIKILKNHPTASLCDETIIMPYKNENSVAEFINILDEITNKANNINYHSLN